VRVSASVRVRISECTRTHKHTHMCVRVYLCVCVCAYNHFAVRYVGSSKRENTEQKVRQTLLVKRALCLVKRAL